MAKLSLNAKCTSLPLNLQESLTKSTCSCLHIAYFRRPSWIRADEAKPFYTYPVATSHILMVLSLEAETMWSPLGMMATDDTLWSWPVTDTELLIICVCVCVWDPVVIQFVYSLKLLTSVGGLHSLRAMLNQHVGHHQHPQADTMAKALHFGCGILVVSVHCALPELFTPCCICRVTRAQFGKHFIHSFCPITKSDAFWRKNFIQEWFMHTFLWADDGPSAHPCCRTKRFKLLETSAHSWSFVFFSHA